MKLFKILMFSILVFGSSIAVAQTNDILFGYDANGNRTSRIIDTHKDCLAKTDTTDSDDEILEKNLSWESQIGDTQVSFFPNPVHQWLNIEVNGVGDWEIGNYKVIDNSGKMIEKGSLNANNQVDFNNHPPGMYLLEIEIDHEKKVWKIIKD